MFAEYTTDITLLYIFIVLPAWDSSFISSASSEMLSDLFSAAATVSGDTLKVTGLAKTISGSLVIFTGIIAFNLSLSLYSSADSLNEAAFLMKETRKK